MDLRSDGSCLPRSQTVEATTSRACARGFCGGTWATLLAAKPPQAARLLPAFDPWVLGASRLEGLLDPAHKPLVYRAQGWISPVVLVNGRIAGVWKHARKGRRLVVEVAPFVRLQTWARAQVQAEAERLAGFLGGELTVSIR